MSLQLAHAYAFIGGAIIGRFTGILSSAVISGILLYVADSSIFTIDNIINSRNTILKIILNNY